MGLGRKSEPAFGNFIGFQVLPVVQIEDGNDFFKFEKDALLKVYQPNFIRVNGSSKISSIEATIVTKHFIVKYTLYRCRIMEDLKNAGVEDNKVKQKTEETLLRFIESLEMRGFIRGELTDAWLMIYPPEECE